MGDEVQLVRDLENRYDKSAIRAVWNDAQIGWIPAGDYYLARHIDCGLEVQARIVNLPECTIYNDGTIRCIVQIAKQPIEESPLVKLDIEDEAIRTLIAESKHASDSLDAIRMLLQAMQRIKRLEAHLQGLYFRTVKCPVARLVLMLAGYGKPISALRIAKWWQQSHDRIGITEAQEESLLSLIDHVESRLVSGGFPYDAIELSNAIKKRKELRLKRYHRRRNRQ